VPVTGVPVTVVIVTVVIVTVVIMSVAGGARREVGHRVGVSSPGRGGRSSSSAA
jgi:hypothetical protein